MANTVIVKVKVQELSKYGFKANDRYVGLSKNLSEADKTRLVPGAEFEAEYYVADSGKEYLNKILASVSSAPQSPGDSANAPKTAYPKVDTERAKKFTPKYEKKAAVSDSEKMSKADWSAKDRSQLIGGLSHDAAAITAALVTVIGDIYEPKNALTAYKELLVGMLAIREEVK